MRALTELRSPTSLTNSAELDLPLDSDKISDILTSRIIQASIDQADLQRLNWPDLLTDSKTGITYYQLDDSFYVVELFNEYEAIIKNADKTRTIIYRDQDSYHNRKMLLNSATNNDITLICISDAPLKTGARIKRAPGNASGCLRAYRVMPDAPATSNMPLDVNIPLDHIIYHEGNTIFHVMLDGIKSQVFYDAEVGGWRQGTRPDRLSNYVWPTTITQQGITQWKSGTLHDFLAIKEQLPTSVKWKRISLSPLPIIPVNAKIIPKQIHYIWLGNEIPPNLIDNIIKNSNNAIGYNSIVHVDTEYPEQFDVIKNLLDNKVTGLEVRDLKKDPFFKEFKATNSGEVFAFFRSIEPVNFSAASDVLRYPLIQRYGGIYLDTDDRIVNFVGNVELPAMPNDILLNTSVWHGPTNFLGYNTSNFASHPNNPVLAEIIDQVCKAYQENKSWFYNNRPFLWKNSKKLSREKFYEYQRRIFASTGPMLFSDVLRKIRPDYYHVYEQVGQELSDIIIPSRAYREAREAAVDYYLPFFSKFEVEIGAEQSMKET